MKTISLKIDEAILAETDKILQNLNKPRNRYINEAVENYNKMQKRALLEKMLACESKLVKKESLKVLKEFEDLE
jgi:metal-responsive CopG/Arc/MetJ family transcriptional regulator